MIADNQPAASWPVLAARERRVLGVLAEKAKTTPDAYPLSLNALVTGCNQKSNRDPILNLSEDEVADTLAALQQKVLVIRVQGHGRVERWRHNLYDSWKLEKVELAVLAELLLRGAQTEGELRGRASRMEPIDDLDSLRQVLRPLTERGLVVYLTPEGRRGTLLTHGFHAPKELAVARAAAGTGELNVAAPAPPSPEPLPDSRMERLEEQLTQARADLATLRGQVADLQTALTAVHEEVRMLKEALGV